MIIIPHLIWNKMLEEFRKRWRRVEQVAYLDGIESGINLSVVTTLTIPDAKLGRANFSVSATAMNEAGQHLGTLTRLAQVHTHPTEWVGHSETDDYRAYSHHNGAVSIVLPNYGRGNFSNEEVGIHVCENKIWRELLQSDKKAFLQFVPSLLDFRK